MTTNQNDPQSTEPNHYQLKGLNTLVTYATTGVIGRPQLTYTRKGVSHSFQGDEIRVQESEMGKLVTVTLVQSPDLQTVTLTLVVPLVNLDKTGLLTIHLPAVITTARTTIGGPRLVHGQVQTYETVALEGVASSIYS